MNIYIYDIEVFSDDWIVVFRRPEKDAPHIVIHNDNERLREFLNQPEIVLAGFNNKHYDNWVVLTMINGGSNVEVKRCNDFIIKEKKAGWEFPFIQFKKFPCPTFDLKDDIVDKGLSLKAIEGNLNLPIVESSVDFDIDRKLTSDELKEVIHYCKCDVDTTIKLYWERKVDYLDAKALVGKMYGVPPEEAISFTNAKLSAKVLDAKAVERTDERDYVIPDNIDVDLIPKVVLDFFMQIRDKSIPYAKLFGNDDTGGMTLEIMLKTSYGSCPVTYAWGGVHGAKPCVIVEETADRVIINQDVGSLYPNSMKNFGYCSRSMKDSEAYIKLIDKRLVYKKSAKELSKKLAQQFGDDWYKRVDDILKDCDEATREDIKNQIDFENKQAALKLVINTVYGAMLNRYNDLADRWAGRSVCISNQLAITMLIVQLAKQCKTIDFININTDGIMFTIDRTEVDLSEKIVKEWSDITKFEMERDDFKKVFQKDVNNYIGITPDGKFKTKGGYVSLYKGGNFKTNSLQIIHKAIVEYLVNGVAPERTIQECKDIFAFQQIVKTGGTFEGSYHYVNGKRESVQKVNRIYAVKDAEYGVVVKGKWITEKRRKNNTTGKMDIIAVDPPQWSETVISECPEHTYIDNENSLTIDKLDLNYYIDMAKKRIDKYINIDPKVQRRIEKIKQEVVIMATEKQEKSVSNDTFATMNIYAKLNEARRRFLNSGVKKTGVNRYAEFKYFTLDDIIPVKQSIFNELGLVDIISFTDEKAELMLVNVDNSEECIFFTSPLEDDESLIKNPIQKLGAVETYIRRYLYMLELDIVESDTVDGVSGKPTDDDNKQVVTPKKSNRPATPEERQETKKELINEGGEATPTQVKAIKNGLKKLRDKDEKYEAYIGDIVKKLKAGMAKVDAENVLIEIGNKIEE